MRAVVISLVSGLLTSAVILNAYNQKKQFYPSVVYITKSSPSMAILYLQAFVFVILMGKIMRKVFFGQLRPAEMEHLIERSWYAVTETCLAFTVFRDDFSPRFVALFTVLLFLKCFHWLAEDRIDYMERSPAISILFHARAIALMTVLSIIDLYFVNHAYDNTLIKGPSVQLVFGFEYAILFTMVMHVLIKYLLHTLDLNNENPWENKAVYLLYAELMLGFCKVLLYLLFLAIMMKVHTFPLFIVRPMYLTIREFKKALNDVIMSRRAIHNMNTMYPTATEEELAAGDNVCIICREEMHSNAKKLPCNHIFHTNCLRSWFQRQQTCPTCRMDVFRSNRPNGTPAAAPQPQAAAQNVPPAQAPAPQNVQQPNVPMFQPPMFPGFVPPTMTNGSQGHRFPPFLPFMSPPAMPFTIPFGLPFPPPPPVGDLRGLNEEELRLLEGQERVNLEARVQCLRDIQTLLNAAVLQMQQYVSVINTPNNNFQPKPTSASSVQTGPTKETKSPASHEEVDQNNQSLSKEQDPSSSSSKKDD